MTADWRLAAPALVAWLAALGVSGCGAVVRTLLGGLLIVGAAAAAVWARRTDRTALAGLALWAAVCGTVIGAAGLQAQRHQVGPLVGFAQQRVVVTVSATVAEYPRLAPRVGSGSRVTSIVKIDVHQVTGRGRTWRVASPVTVFAAESWQSLQPGQRIRAVGRLAPASDGTQTAVLAALGPVTLEAPLGRLRQATARIRSGLSAAARPLPADARGLLPGLVYGDTSGQPPDLVVALRAAGLTHLSAVSGSNTTLICGAVWWLASALGLPRRARLTLTAGALLAFVTLVGPQPSILRAAAMGVIGLWAVASGRSRQALGALAAAIIVLLVVYPDMARSYGFGLSVLATLGLVLLAPGWTAAVSRLIPTPLAAAMVIPLAAQLMCAPVLVALSPEISLVSWPANILAAPLVAPATIVGLAAALVSPASQTLASGLAWVAGWPCRGIAKIARSLAAVEPGQLPWLPEQPMAIRVGSIAVVAALLGLLGYIGFTQTSTPATSGSGPPAASSPRNWARRCRWALGVAIAGLAGALLPLPIRPGGILGGSSWPPPDWVLVACDVGQGDALVLNVGPGRAILVDAGPDKRMVDGCLRRLGVKRLEVIFLTHFHADHVAGLRGALEGRAVGQVITTIVDDPPTQAAQVRDLLAASAVPIMRVGGSEPTSVGAVRWQVVGPSRRIGEASVPNNASIVLLVKSRGLRLLLTGDIEPPAAAALQRHLSEIGELVPVDVIKVAHHGSARQSAPLLQQLKPSLALISVGRANDYGHPAPATLGLLASLPTQVARTDLDGDLAVVARSGQVMLAVSGRQR